MAYYDKKKEKEQLERQARTRARYTDAVKKTNTQTNTQKASYSSVADRYLSSARKTAEQFSPQRNNNSAQTTHKQPTAKAQTNRTETVNRDNYSSAKGIKNSTDRRATVGQNTKGQRYLVGHGYVEKGKTENVYKKIDNSPRGYFDSTGANKPNSIFDKVASSQMNFARQDLNARREKEKNAYIYVMPEEEKKRLTTDTTLQKYEDATSELEKQMNLNNSKWEKWQESVRSIQPASQQEYDFAAAKGAARNPLRQGDYGANEDTLKYFDYLYGIGSGSAAKEGANIIMSSAANNAALRESINAQTDAMVTSNSRISDNYKREADNIQRQIDDINSGKTKVDNKDAIISELNARKSEYEAQGRAYALGAQYDEGVNSILLDMSRDTEAQRKISVGKDQDKFLLSTQDEDGAYEAAWSAAQSALGGNLLDDNVDYRSAAMVMTEEEKQGYYYALATKGEEGAQKYVAALYDAGDLGERYADWLNGIAENSGAAGQVFSYLQIVPAGVNNAVRGFRDAGARIMGDETVRNEALAMKIYQNNVERGTVNKVAGDLIFNVSNMIPAISVSVATMGVGAPAAVAGVASASATGLSSFGNTYQQARREGFDSTQATEYAVLNGISEAALQYALTGVSSMAGGVVTKGLGKTVSGAIARVVKNPVGKYVLNQIMTQSFNAAGEFTEEYLQEILNNVFRNWALGENNEINPFSEDALYAGLLGALSAGAMNSVNVVGDTAHYRMNGRRQIETITEIVNKGMAFSADLEAHKTAEYLQEKIKSGDTPSDLEVGLLVEQNNQAKAAVDSVRGALNGYLDWNNITDSGRKMLVNPENAAYLRDTFGINVSENMTPQEMKTAFKDAVASNMEKAGVRHYTDAAVNTEGTENTNQKFREVAEKVENTTGKRVLVADDITDENGNSLFNGFTVGDAIVINSRLANTEEGAAFVLAHEVTHGTENTKEYSSLLKTAKEFYGDEWDNIVQQKIADYSTIQALNENSAEREIVADFVAKNILGSNLDELNTFVEEHSSLAKRIMSWLKNRIKGVRNSLTENMESEELALYQRAYRNFENAFNAMQRGAGDFAVQYSIQHTENGVPYVKIDRTVTKDDLDGTGLGEEYIGKTIKEIPAKERVEVVRNILYGLENVEIDVLDGGIDGKTPETIEITFARYGEDPINQLQSTEGKMLSVDKKRGDEKGNYAENYANRKLPAVAHVDEIIQISKWDDWSEDKKTENHGDFSKNGFEYRTALINMDGKWFEVSLSVALGENTNTAYNLNPFSFDRKSDTQIRKMELSAQKNHAQLRATENSNNNIPQGQDNSQDVSKLNLPKNTDFSRGEFTSKYGQTLQNAGVTPEVMATALKSSIENGDFQYERIANAKLKRETEAYIKTNGIDEAITNWNGVVASSDIPKVKEIALGQYVYNHYLKQGDFDKALETARDLAMKATEAGQVVQALKLINRMSPDGKLYMLEKIAAKWEEKILSRSRVPEGFTGIKIDNKLAENLLKARGKKEIDAASEAIEQNIADQVPATWMDKLRAWRYMSMLMNPKTHIRNVFGNIAFMPMRLFKDLIGSGMESVAQRAGKMEQSERTKSVANLKTKENKQYLNAAKEAFGNYKNVITGQAKYGSEDTIEQKRRIFKSKVLNWLSKFNSWALEAEDVIFMKTAFVGAYAKAMKARGLTSETMTAKQESEIAEYAIKEAQKATYRDANALANALNKFKRSSKIGYVLGEGLVPFTKTPLNILRRGIEYSPVGVIKGVYQTLNGVKSGNTTVAEAIDTLSSGLSGSAVMALGMFLASQGLISGGSSDDDEAVLNNLQGKQEYALQIGDKSYTVDWAVPMALPLFMGVEIFNSSSEENGGDKSIARMFDSVTKISDPLFNLSVLQSLNNAVEAAKYSEGSGVIADIGINIATSYAGQYVPTLLGQFARIADDTQRKTYFEDGSPLPKAVDSMLQGAQKKIPGLSMIMSPSVDRWGREKKTGDIPERLLENLASPGYYSEESSDDVDKEVDRLYARLGDANVIPPLAEKSITWSDSSGESGEMKLNASQYAEYSKKLGSIAYDGVKSLITSETYKNLTDRQKVEAIANIYKYAKSVAKNEMTGGKYELDKWAQTVKDNNGILGDYASFRAVSAGSNSAEKRTLLDSMKIHDDVKEELYRSMSSDSEIKTLDEALNNGARFSQYLDAKIAIDKIDDSDAENKSIKKKEWLVRNISSEKSLVALYGSLFETDNTDERNTIKYAVSQGVRAEAFLNREIQKADETTDYDGVSEDYVYKVVDGEPQIVVDEKGKAISGSKMKKALAHMLNGGYTDEEMTYFYQKEYGSDDTFVWAKMSGMSTQDYLEFRESTAGLKADKDANGKSISGSLKKKIFDAIESLQTSRINKLMMYMKSYTLSKQQYQEVIDYVNSLNLSKDNKLQILAGLGVQVENGIAYPRKAK